MLNIQDQLGISGEQKAEMLGLSDVKKEALLAQNASFLSYNNGSSSFSLKKHKSPGVCIPLPFSVHITFVCTQC